MTRYGTMQRHNGQEQFDLQRNMPHRPNLHYVHDRDGDDVS